VLGLDVPGALPTPMQDFTRTAPMARITSEAASAGLMGDTQVAGLEALLSISTPVQGAPAPVELPRLSKSATDWAEKHLAAMPQWKSAHHESRPTRTVAFIPAHNEETSIAATVASIRAQDRQLDRILAVCDNCADSTQREARAAGAETYVTVDNHEMKAGALNQALALVMPGLADDDLVLCVDADSIIGENFVSEAIKQFARNPKLGGVSGTYLGKPGGGFAGWCQRNEFARWGFDNRMEHGRTVILSGAASMFRVAALRRVQEARASGQLPGSNIYSAASITEDFELSLALLHTGSTIKNMLNVQIMTSVKPSWRELYIQRLRWDRGINEGLFQYGITRHTRLVWFRRVMYAVFVPASFLCLGMIMYRLVAGNILATNLFWITITAVMMTQKAATVLRSRGWLNAAGAFVIFPELPYDTFLQLTFVRSLWDQITHHSKKWR
jgi:cellulose synthase/poly-beta-1,6-N-acetylglucosamine synthase-like glycosyltransferase